MFWIQIFMAIMAYLKAKKEGASTTNAALIGAGVGLATHWAVTETEWGQNNLQPINDRLDGWFGIGQGDVDGSGNVTDGSGNPVTVPAGHTAVKQPDGSVVFIPNKGTTGLLSGALSTTGNVLESWGPQGTATVIGAATVASKFDELLPYGLALGGIWLLTRD
jgi:hypothetical protein